MAGAKYNTNWASSFQVPFSQKGEFSRPGDPYSADRPKEAEAEEEEGRILELNPVLLYPKPANGQQPHAVFFTQTGQMLSNPYFCDNCDEEHEPPMTFMQVDKGGLPPVAADVEWESDTLFVIVDPFGNELVHCKGTITAGGLKSAHRKAVDEIENLQERLWNDLKKAKWRLEREHYSGAIGIYREMLKYRGYPSIEKARKGLEDLYDWGRTEVRSVLASDDPRWKKSRRLKQLEDWYEGTELEAEVRQAQEHLE